MTSSPRTLSTFLSEFGLLVHEGRQRGLEYSSPASMEAPSNAPPLALGGDNPRPVGEPRAHYYIGNAKIATMFASHRASGKRRWAALGDWTSWSDGYYLGVNSENSQQSCGENRA
jgi:hypothetical protein